MFVYLANKITMVLINYEIIGKEDEEIYRYGFEMLIYFIVNWIGYN
ncbi:accessory gene regulator B family protein [Turicibacter sanguinis]|nr:accessory gene regulator B family protein [Turicibacter sanguinis]